MRKTTLDNNQVTKLDTAINTLIKCKDKEYPIVYDSVIREILNQVYNHVGDLAEFIYYSEDTMPDYNTE